MRPQKRGKKDDFKSKGKISEKKRSKKQNISDVFEVDTDNGYKRKENDLDDVEIDEDKVVEIKDEDDEDIDSDEAFDESDEERFEGFKFLGSSKPTKSAIEEEEGEEEEGEEYMDLADMPLDDEDEEDPDESHQKVFDELMPHQSDEENYDYESLDEEDDDEEMEEKAERDISFINSLDTNKRKAEDERGSRKRTILEKTEVQRENEFSLPAQEEDGGDQKLDFSDLMGSLEDEAAFTSLRKSLKELGKKAKDDSRGTVAAPVGKRIQDRLDRQVAYKHAKKEITKWQPTVQDIRQAEHLSFPLQPAQEDAATSGSMVGKFAPQTSLEQQIQDELEKAGLKDEELEAFEALQLNKLSVEEVEKRRNELKFMRELMFRHELKAKRLSKIKSKSYRKLKRKDKLKELDALQSDLTEEDKLDAATKRAEERMSLRHKNTGKWAKRALARGQTDEGTRDAIMEQLSRGEELRHKIRSGGSDESDSDSDSENDMDYRKKVHDELDDMEQELAQDTQPKKGLFGMKFMQEAEKKNREATKVMIDEFKNEWLDEDEDEDEEISASNGKQEAAHYTHVQNNTGRMAFGSIAAKEAKDSDKEQEEDSSARLAKVSLNEAGQVRGVSHGAGHHSFTTGNVNIAGRSASNMSDEEESNPWLNNDTSRLGKKASKGNRVLGKDDSKSDASVAKIKLVQRLAAADQEPEVEIDVNNRLTVSRAKGKKSSAGGIVELGNSDSDSEEDPQDLLRHESDQLSLSHRELVARAFANDDVVEEFVEEKEAVIEADGDQEEDTSLPGWGQWEGAGQKKKKKKTDKRFIKVTKGIDPSKRQDAGLGHVIINEKRNKKTEKYQATAVPYPFETLEQYERSLRTPVGKEWNTRNTFQKMTKPRIMTKLGTVIDPLSAPFK